MSDGFTVSPDELRAAVEGIEDAALAARAAATAMTSALHELAELVPGTEVARRAVALAGQWSDDAATWAGSAHALGELLDGTAGELAGADAELARGLGEADR